MEEKKVLEKYETPEVDFVEMEDDDIMTNSCTYNCPNKYGNYCEEGHQY